MGIDTRTPTGKFFLTAAFSELDREIIKVKQRSGIKLASKRGNIAEGLKNIQISIKLRISKTTDKTVKELCAITGISQAEIYRRLRGLVKDNV